LLTVDQEVRCVACSRCCLVLLAVGIGVEEYALGYGRAYVQDRWLGPDPLSEPAAVPAPEGLSLSPVPTPSVVAAAVDLTAVPRSAGCGGR
jgi:hypothetical protein